MKKLLSITLALCLMLSLFAGCGGNGSSSGTDSKANSTASTASTASTGSTGSQAAADPLADLPDEYVASTKVAATPEMYPDVDMSSAYTVNVYLIGDKPNDWQRVEDEINTYLEPFNTKIATTFMSWSDYQTMYSLNLAGGAEVDLIFTAPWCYMFVEAPKGSFVELTEEFRQKYMPLTTKYQAPESWDETTIQGKTIAVPSDEASPMGKIVAIRQDLADKYGIAPLETWDDYKNYCLTIAEKETPESGIYAMAAAGGNSELWDVYRGQYDTMYALQSGNVSFLYQYEDGKIPTKDDIKFTYEYDFFRDFAKEMKEMADAGCWSRSALTNTVTDDDAFGNLQGASIAWNASVFTYMEQAEKTEGVECMAYDVTKDNIVCAEAYSNNDMAIAAGSRNPERSAMVLDIMKFDTYVNNLIMLGIEGEHYELNENYEYTELEAASEYPVSTVSASWAIKNATRVESGTPEREKVITDSWAERVKMTPTITFVFDDSGVKSFMSAVDAVLADYVPMLQLGLVEDVDATLDEMLQKCEESGLQTIKDEFYKQYEAWAATR